MSNNYLKLYNKMKTSEKTLQVCPVTGIILTINIPFIPFALEYRNPLASLKEATELASLSYKEHSAISPHILAGTLLSIFNHYEIIKDNLNNTERNMILSTVPSFYLSEALRFFSTQSLRRMNTFPKLSLSIIGECRESSVFTIFKNYLEECRKCYLPSSSISSPSIIEKRVKTTKNTSASITTETRKEIKALIKEIIFSCQTSSKLTNVLISLSEGNNVITMSSTLRQQVIERLDVYTNSPQALKLSSILTSISSTPIEDELKEVDTFSNEKSYGKKLTLLEMLALRKASIKKEEPEMQEEKLSLEDYTDDDSEGEDNNDEF